MHPMDVLYPAALCVVPLVAYVGLVRKPGTTRRGVLAGCTLVLALACRPRSPSTEEVSTFEAVRLAVLADERTAEFNPAGKARAGGAVVMDEGHIALLDHGGKRIVVIDTTGRVKATFGRGGGGPGEFGNPRFMARTPSGLAVYDDLKLALVAFDAGGKPLADLSQMATLGGYRGLLTGFALLADGSWVYSVTEQGDGLVRESLYLRVRDTSQLLARTAGAPARWLRLPCGITMGAGPPAFWPSLRWAASGTRVAWAVSDRDRVVVWDVIIRDSTVTEGNARPRRATRAAALAVTTGYSVATPGRNCSIEREQVLDQRGTMKTIPPIAEVALTPGGALWVGLAGAPDESPFIRIHRGSATDALTGAPFPGLFLSETRYVAEETDSVERVRLSLWEVRPRRP